MGINEAWVARQEASDESRRLHERDRLAVWTMDSIAGLMEDQAVSKAELARKIGTSRSYVTQVFSGSKNPTLATVADLAWALGFRACVKFEPLRSGEFMSVPVQSCKVHALPKRREVNSVTRMRDPEDGGLAGFGRLTAAGGL
ncbi:helix-turn-helix domain-containing protein [Rhodanobacter sp. DHB23]|uniref:helix-turn-helix domain-containing protein n=1 Tax=Rhodanobacter sp. DHB23 TaxID=2775923 RepID=UPI00178377A4|nr:helix-turn-helix domain-containing protein [Rhodanobacter sp. DHB23]MBD8872882.1 helix-turn-helix domain-containing protein [Rhodanobacter sp. DHB23]